MKNAPYYTFLYTKYSVRATGGAPETNTVRNNGLNLSKVDEIYTLQGDNTSKSPNYPGY